MKLLLSSLFSMIFFQIETNNKMHMYHLRFQNAVCESNNVYSEKYFNQKRDNS